MFFIVIVDYSALVIISLQKYIVIENLLLVMFALVILRFVFGTHSRALEIYTAKLIWVSRRVLWRNEVTLLSYSFSFLSSVSGE